MLPRLDCAKPWDPISRFWQQAWRTKHSYTILTCPKDPSIGGRTPMPALSIYLALAALPREVHAAWPYVDMPSHGTRDYRRVADPWRFGVVYEWVRYATACLGRCPEASADVLRPRVADACVKARIGACSALRCMPVR